MTASQRDEQASLIDRLQGLNSPAAGSTSSRSPAGFLEARAGLGARN